MTNPEPNWKWQDGVVEPLAEHIELRCGDARTSQYEDWLPVARIGRPQAHTFSVQWLLSPESPEQESIIADARRELDYYLITLQMPDPWAYAAYHCDEYSNMYSKVHWSFFPDGQSGPRESTRVLHVAGRQSKLLKGNLR